MEIKTKFDLGQTVYGVKPTTEDIWEDCPICGGTGYVDIKDKKYECPDWDCHQGKVFKGIKYNQYKIVCHSKIGQVRVEIRKDSYKECYMLVATGIETGTLWYDDEEYGSRMFATKQEAEEFCKEKNNKNDKL